MTNAVLEKAKAVSQATGIVTRMPSAADEVRLVVLDSMGNLASETSKASPEGPMVTLSFNPSLMEKAGKELYFLVVKGLVKGNLAWEQRLGAFRFHA